ncbi:A-macroglobulin complement component [Singulisphaera sp. GP187]|uniref:DUF4159 domain-containing protein n=1 Tax=Singulisphaera sp. GP187 TaxID=1882752 RepID=UPI000925E46F|nr:DUF4159 domain-containing protein [Singulisphaera sp. GP187]SIO60953.1 A-macroglobulin complement component [Singulisphaera sp. GP187]
MSRIGRFLAIVLGIVGYAGPLLTSPAQAAVTREEVERAIREGVRFLKQEQRGDGSWSDVDNDAHTGSTSLVTLALLTAGEPTNSLTIRRALGYLRNFGPDELKSTYAVALQTMVFAAAEPERDQLKLVANVEWLTRAQIRPADRVNWPGSWTYSVIKNRHGDNSNSQYALLGLHAANEVGIPVRPDVWTLARSYWENCQHRDGGWAYTPDASSPASGSMTSAGISSLIITGLKRYQGQETLVGDEIHNCGKGGVNVDLVRGLDWMANHFRVGENFGHGQQWRYYYLYGMERAGRLTGRRFFGEHDWYREGAEKLVHDQDPLRGFWRGAIFEQDPVVATSFSLLFLAKGRSPVLINKLRHGPKSDWDNDPDDIRNLVGVVSRDWKPLLGGQLLTWQIVDPNVSTVEDLMQAPIAYFNGHKAPEFTEEGEKNLRSFVEQGGFIFAEACCSSKEFDSGFRELMKRIFPEEEYKLDTLSEEHAVWRARHLLSPDVHPLWGIEHGCRTVVIYSPEDLSCYWNQAENSPANPAVIKALRVGQNVVDYATGRELPADKLAVREVKDFKPDSPRRGALHIAKLVHAGDWNVAPLAIPNLTTSLRQKSGLDVVINHKELFPNDPNIVHFPLIYLHGRAAFTYSKEDTDAIRRHLTPGGGTLFADAACGSSSFDTSFRKFVATLLPNTPLVAIPRDDEIYSKKVGYDLADVHFTKAAGGGVDYPQLEGIKIDGHWAVIYSKYDLGCALERHQGLDCKGYSYESALRIATNIVLYSTLP